MLEKVCWSLICGKSNRKHILIFRNLTKGNQNLKKKRRKKRTLIQKQGKIYLVIQEVPNLDQTWYDLWWAMLLPDAIFNVI